ncbi:hypothetical protein ES703_85587 [subsurface metagenome]
MDILAEINGLELIRGGIAVPAGELLTVTEGDTVRVHMTVDYRGPAVDGAIWTAIGWTVIFFEEKFAVRLPVHFDASAEFVTYDITCDVPIVNVPWTGMILYGDLFDIYAKIMEVPGPDIFTPTYKNIIKITRVGEFQNFDIVSYEKV